MRLTATDLYDLFRPTRLFRRRPNEDRELLGSGTLVAIVLTDAGLLVAADSRQGFTRIGTFRDDAAKIELVKRPARTVLCLTGHAQVHEVGNEVESGYVPGPDDVVFDFKDVIVDRLLNWTGCVDTALLQQITLDCVQALRSSSRIKRDKFERGLAGLVGRPFLTVILATSVLGGRGGRLGLADLAVKSHAQIEPARVACLDIIRQGEPRFFGDPDYIERTVPTAYRNCSAALRRTPLPHLEAATAITKLIATTGANSHSPVGGPTDVVLIGSEVRKLQWKE